MKRILRAVIVFICIVLLPACVIAESASITRADPNDNVNSPDSLPYSGKGFAFAKYTYTKSIKAPSDGKITISLSNTKLGINRTATCYIEVCYWNGSTWRSVSVSPSKFSVSNTAQSYTFTASGLPSGSSFYVGLSKSDYTDYSVGGTISVTD